MRKYLSKLLIFVIILYIVLLLIDYGYSAFIRTSNWRPVEAWTDVVKGNIDSEIVALGSSRTWVQIDPQILDSILSVNSYNLGFEGSPINRQVQKYEIFRKRNSKPKIILQNIDAWSLDYTIGYEKEQFFPFFWDKDMKRLFSQSEPFTFEEKFIPLYRYHGLSPKLFVHSFPPTLYKGYQGQNSQWNGKAFAEQKSIEFTVNDTTYRLFDSYLRETKNEDIQVIFVYAPLYSGATQKISNLDEMHKTYKMIADKYGIPILDYSNMDICYDTTYFYNAMHLNKVGAEIFTDSLANDIKRLEIL